MPFSVFFDKSLAKKAEKILFIEVSNDGFTLSDTRQPIEKNDLPLALQVVSKFKKSISRDSDSEFVLSKEELKIAVVAKKTEIDEFNAFNLIGKRYRVKQASDSLKWHRVSLADICVIIKGNSPIMKTSPGPYPLVVTAEDRKTSDHFDIDGSATCIPLISSTGHGHASLKRLHYQEGRFALAACRRERMGSDASRAASACVGTARAHAPERHAVTGRTGSAMVTQRPGKMPHPHATPRRRYGSA